MPPAAISRSSTYFPKICGNIGPGYRSAFSALLLVACAQIACAGPETPSTRVTVSAHQLENCPVPERAPSNPSPFRLTLTALGAFRASGFDLETDIGVNDAGHALTFDPETTGVDAVASDAPDNVNQAYVGHTERRDGRQIDVVLWPNRVGCAVLGTDESAYPGGNAGQALGYSPTLGVALAAGGCDDRRAGTALAFNTETGEAGLVEREQGALRVSRAYATVTAFGDGLLVAGGTNPFAPATAPADASGTAEVYLPAGTGFDSAPFELSFRRTHHAALTLPTTGETLLVGGVAPDSSGTRPGLVIRQLEAVSPVTRSSSITNLAELTIGRVEPVALVLTNGRLFVGGGYAAGVDATETGGAPVGLVEWFSPDAITELFTAELPARPRRTFATLPGGGVLSVASCQGETRTLREDCACIDESGAACADLDDQDWVNAWWLDANGTPQRVQFARGGVLASCPTPERPMLLAGSDGSPWLVSTRSDGNPACLWRFEPWPEGSATADEATSANDPSLHARFVMTALTLDPAPDPRSPPLSLGPDTFLWVPPEGGLFGARFGHRGPLTRDDLSLLNRGNSPFRPAHLVPDRDPQPLDAASPDAPAPSVVLNVNGSLTLTPVIPPVTVWATDTLYDDLTVSLEVGSVDGASTAFPALVFGGTSVEEPSVCTWPEPPDGAALPSPLLLTAERRGGSIVLSAPGVGSTTCAVPIGPSAIGVRAGSTTTLLASGNGGLGQGLRLARE